MKVEILISCMHQKDVSLAMKSKISGDVLIINQTNWDGLTEITEDGRCIRMISTTERGLSRSRNMAMQNALGDFCLLGDDDEEFVEGYAGLIEEYFCLLPEADIIAFDLKNKVTRLKPCVSRVGRLSSMRLCSCQLAFRKESVLRSGVRFDPYMGSGSGNGCGEENKFLLDCLKAGLKIYYVPKQIAALKVQESAWFFGFDEKFFFQRGSATRYMLGLFPAILYGLYYILTKHSMYKKEISMKAAFIALMKGIKANIIFEQKNKAKNG
ncbi:glycosyltransferase family 2 protein [Anaeromassilibacillus senegalensis]|uniref:Glycosyltransferase family 2 protein n=1 Tax=Anaeromassilibacillus senegalensis TaxID=1673717 RepID=A0ABS9CSA9_9FIRM|nr:glycosyltransferase [Anaeromassilibacillus senegalensis]MCF2653175.1 glycosyltransferase family 2 protein [Anaeromassilibacillus senegalensis]